MGRYDRNRSKKSNNTVFIIAVLVSLLIGISGTYYVMENFKAIKEVGSADSIDTKLNEPAIAEEFPQEQQLGGDELEILPLEPVTLDSIDQPVLQSGQPDLLSSDGYVRQEIVNISPGLSEWFSADQLLRRYVVIANDFAQGSRISKHMSILRFNEPFVVEQQGENGLYISPKSFTRYNKLAQTVQAINTKAAVAVYQKFRPLMLQVFAEFSYPKDFTLETIIKKAAGEIIAAPVIEGQISLIRPSVLYKFADPKLEALNDVQKQMIRMGPENTKIIQNKCREFLVELAKSNS
ncbi:DUF3014 domain-containing protein [Methyloglobulus sp.]|uniref:DUF3014 domain-containing protein n=1 Tax=Methyloglobulus sp. TaxID=2518622 RepID=UPI001845F49D|nr:DUF3014 domain-containing protein [Methyloglobulus sp.]